MTLARRRPRGGAPQPHQPREVGRGRGPRQPRALVLTPTRELALQVHESVRGYGKHLRLFATAIYGGAGMNPQIDSLRANLAGGREISRISPLHWRARARVERLEATGQAAPDAALRQAQQKIAQAMAAAGK